MNKKAEDPNKLLENIRRTGGNKQCFDCGEKGTTYAVINIGVFVCSSCAGIHRDINNKVKGVGVSNFTEKELDFLQTTGNDVAKTIWMGHFNPNKHKQPDPKDAVAMKSFIKAKYQEKKYYSATNDKSNGNKKKTGKEAEESSSSDEEPTSKKPSTKSTQNTTTSKTSTTSANATNVTTNTKPSAPLKKLGLGKPKETGENSKATTTPISSTSNEIDEFEFVSDAPKSNNSANNKNNAFFDITSAQGGNSSSKNNTAPSFNPFDIGTNQSSQNKGNNSQWENIFEFTSNNQPNNNGSSVSKTNNTDGGFEFSFTNNTGNTSGTGSQPQTGGNKTNNLFNEINFTSGDNQPKNRSNKLLDQVYVESQTSGNNNQKKIDSINDPLSKLMDMNFYDVPATNTGHQVYGGGNPGGIQGMPQVGGGIQGQMGGGIHGMQGGTLNPGANMMNPQMMQMMMTQMAQMNPQMASQMQMNPQMFQMMYMNMMMQMQKMNVNPQVQGHPQGQGGMGAGPNPNSFPNINFANTGTSEIKSPPRGTNNQRPEDAKQTQQDEMFRDLFTYGGKKTTQSGSSGMRKQSEEPYNPFA